MGDDSLVALADTSTVATSGAEATHQVMPHAEGFMIDIARFLLRVFGATHVSETVATLLMVFLSTVVSISIFWLVRRILFSVVDSIVKKTNTDWDDKIFNHKVLNRAAYLPSIISMMAFGMAIEADNWIIHVYMKCVFLYMTLSVSQFLVSLINSVFEAFCEKNPKLRSLGSVKQLVVYVIYIMMFIVMVSIVIDKNPTAIIGALGASAAIMTLVFKETIESLVAGIQLAGNNMLSPGDWVVVPKADANGIVTEVNLNTVKIRNWDNTITTVPPSTLLKDSFTNWKGMKEGAGRRIARSININMDTVRFLTEEELQRYQYMPELYNFFEHRKQGGEAAMEDVTNLTLFRHYMYTYLSRHPQLVREGKGNNMRVMVRYMPATQHGMPVELYCFTRTKVWEEYEAIMADIMDHTIASLPLFGLRPYQISASLRPDSENIQDPIAHSRLAIDEYKPNDNKKIE